LFSAFFPSEKHMSFITTRPEMLASGAEDRVRVDSPRSSAGSHAATDTAASAC